jgi:putative phosphoesterase
MVSIGLISDTHNLLRPEAARALRGSDHIVHAGDICAQSVIDDLQRIAPVAAVRGNNDYGSWADPLPETHVLRIAGIAILMVHDLATLKFDPVAHGVRVVVSGHSHRPLIERRQGVLYVNPGSAGPRRFRLPVSVGQLVVRGTDIDAKLITLDT